MKRFRIKNGDQKKYKFDFAPLENGRDSDSNWLDRTSSPVEQIGSYTITLDSPTGITILSDGLEDSNTSVAINVQATATGKYKAACQITTSSSPVQKDTREMLFVVVT